MAEAGSAAPWFLRLGAWIGIGTSPGALATGASIGAVTAGWQTVGAIALGAAGLAGLAVANGLRAQRQRTPAIALAWVALGGRGPTAVALLVTVGVTCWNGFYIGIASRAVGDFADVPAPAVALITGAVLWIVYRAGFRQWNALVALTGVAAAAVALLTYAGVPVSQEATEPVSSWDRMLLGGGFVVAYAAVFVVRVPDFTWDARRLRDVALGGLTLTATLGLFLGLGAAVYARAGSWDFPTLVNHTELPGAAVSLLALSIVAPAVSGLHSGALGLHHLAGWHANRGALAVTGVAVVLGAASFDLALQPFLGLLGAVLPPVIATMLLRRPSSPDRHAWVAWAAGAIAAAGAWLGGSHVHVIIGLALAATIMLASRGMSSQRASTERSTS